MTHLPADGAKMLYDAVRKALNSWAKQNAAPETLLSQLLSVQKEQEVLNASDNPALLRAATNKVLTEAISDLEKQNARCANVLRLRFLEQKGLKEVANMLNFSSFQVSRIQRDGIEQLVEIIQGKEQDIRLARVQSLAEMLPPPTYSRLFGVDDLCQSLVRQLTMLGAPWVVALVGMGGVGKTALADFVTRTLIQHLTFAKVIWLRAEPPHSMSGRSLQPRLTYENIINELLASLVPQASTVSPLEAKEQQIRRLLKAGPHLVIVDDLEAEEDTAFLLNHLTDFANPSKFLLTTRTGVTKQATVSDVLLDELSLNDAAAFMRHYAAEIGIPAFAEATDTDIEQIYKMVGGNPHAIKMIIAQLDIIPLPRLLDRLLRDIPKRVEKMYGHIYRQTWDTLSENGRKLLRSMPLVSEPADADYLLSISGLSEGQLWPAIEELRHRSLLEIQGSLHERLYGIHRLTDTFLRTEIIRLPPPKGSPEGDEA